MSFGFGGNMAQTGLSIHNDNLENAEIRRGKREDMPPASKRAALGTITNAVGGRIQPQRHAKTTHAGGFGVRTGIENVQAKQAEKFMVPQQTLNSQAFQIHVDEPTQSSQQPFIHKDISNTDNRLQLTSAITGLGKESQYESTAPICLDESSDSPMCLDTSIEYAQPRHTTLNKEDSQEIILNVPEYSTDIYAYLRDLELKHRPKPNYMKKQPDITNSMRTILVDWLVEVSEEYKLHRETLFLAVNYIDRFLSQMSVLRGKLQLVGAASMFLAAKYEEIYPPEVGEFVYITDDTYTKKQVLRMEHLILKVLSFDVAVPTANIFIERFIKEMNCEEKVAALAMMLAELTLVEGETYLAYPQSVIAASCVVLASKHLIPDTNPMSQVYQVTGYKMPELSACLNELCNTYSQCLTHPQQAVVEKYKSNKYHAVSTIPPCTV